MPYFTYGNLYVPDCVPLYLHQHYMQHYAYNTSFIISTSVVSTYPPFVEWLLII